jgi:hypothetical protein
LSGLWNTVKMLCQFVEASTGLIWHVNRPGHPPGQSEVLGCSTPITLANCEPSMRYESETTVDLPDDQRQFLGA